MEVIIIESEEREDEFVFLGFGLLSSLEEED